MMRLLLLGVFASLVTGCLTFSSFQTADTVKQGSATFFFGLGYQQLRLHKKSDDETTRALEDAIEEIKVPMIEYGLRYGISKDLDLGVRTAMFGAYVADVKYRLVQTQSFSVATGVGAGYGSVSIGEGEASYFEGHLPLYMSYNVSRSVSFYATPRLLYRASKSSPSKDAVSSDSDDDSSSLLYGSSFGVLLGQDFGVTLEYSYLTGPGTLYKAGIQQVMLGFTFGLNHLDRWTPPDEADDSGDDYEEERPRKKKRRRKPRA